MNSQEFVEHLRHVDFFGEFNQDRYYNFLEVYEQQLFDGYNAFFESVNNANTGNYALSYDYENSLTCNFEKQFVKLLERKELDVHFYTIFEIGNFIGRITYFLMSNFNFRVNVEL